MELKWSSLMALPNQNVTKFLFYQTFYLLRLVEQILGIINTSVSARGIALFIQIKICYDTLDLLTRHKFKVVFGIQLQSFV